MENQIKQVDILLECARQKVYTDYEIGLKCLEDAETLAASIDYTEGLAWASLRRGSYLFSKGERLSAVHQYKYALKQMMDLDHKQGIARTHYSLATLYSIMDHYDFALSHYLSSMDLMKIHDPTYYTKLLNNLSNTYCNLKLYDKALEIADLALDYMNENGEERQFMLYCTIGEIYLDQNDYSNALKYADMALEGVSGIDEIHHHAFSNMIIAGGYKGLKHYDEALIVYNRVLKLIETSNNLQNISYIHRNIADIYLIKREYNYAFKHCQIAMTSAIKDHSIKDESESFFLYAKLYETLENYKKAFDSYKKGSELEKKIHSTSVEERYRAYQVEHVDEVKKPEVIVEKPEFMDHLNHTLEELKTTYANITKNERSELTDAFVEAVVETIDIRDTTTAGHSKRIAKYAIEMMRIVDADQVIYKGVTFTDHHMKEMYYAGLMHDIGKLGINETVLLKESRLNKDRVNTIEYRIKYMKACLDLKEKERSLNDGEQEIKRRLDDDFNFIKGILSVYRLNKIEVKRINDMYNQNRISYNGEAINMLTLFDYEHLCVERGNLIGSEWEHMKEHAELTEFFLKELPWLKGLDNVPSIASSHHEKLDGSGYPKGLSGDEITIQMRILSIVDIFEALTASDRPYKMALSIDQALSILWDEANDGKLDQKLLALFENHKVTHLCIDEIETLKSKS